MFVAFADHSDKPHVRLEIRHAYFAKLGNAQSGRVEEFQHCAIPEPLRLGWIRRLHQFVKLLFIKELGEAVPLTGDDEQAGWVAIDDPLFQEELIKIAECGDMPGDGSAGQARLVERIDMAAQESTILEVATRPDFAGKPFQIKLIRVNCRLRQPFLDPAKVEEGSNMSRY